LEPAKEEEVVIIDLADLYEELESLERRLIVQIFHIQQDKLETDGGEYQLEEQLEGVVLEPMPEELTEVNMLEESKQQLIGETVELNFTTRWKDSDTREENDMRDHDDLSTDKEELQPRILHKENQPLEQLDRVIEEIRKLILRSMQEAVSKRELRRGYLAITSGKKQKKKQQ